MEWSEFAERLSHELARLEHDSILILHEHDEHRHYVQVMREPDRIYAEAVSNNFLEGPLQLTIADEEVLEESGWQPPADQGSPANWWTELPPIATADDVAQLVDMVITALRDVQGLRRPADLVYGAFHRHGTSLVELPDLGIARVDPASLEPASKGDGLLAVGATASGTTAPSTTASGTTAFDTTESNTPEPAEPTAEPVAPDGAVEPADPDELEGTAGLGEPVGNVALAEPGEVADPDGLSDLDDTAGLIKAADTGQAADGADVAAGPATVDDGSDGPEGAGDRDDRTATGGSDNGHEEPPAARLAPQRRRRRGARMLFGRTAPQRTMVLPHGVRLWHYNGDTAAPVADYDAPSAGWSAVAEPATEGAQPE